MKFSRRTVSIISLLLGMVFLSIGIATNNTVFSWIAVACVVISLIAGGRWMRPRKK